MKKIPDKTDEKQGKFIKGKSGNPFGRPREVRNRATVLAEKLFEDDLSISLNLDITDLSLQKFAMCLS